MVKRVISAFLWFIATGWALNYLSLLVGINAGVGLAIAGVIGAFMGADPLRVFWSASGRKAASSAPVRRNLEPAVQTSR